jgi:short subunit dehydrogenase-like uncharacterized protein
MTTPFLLYGSYGYTGSLIADLAVRSGMQPILAGRDSVRLKAQADALGLEYRHISLDDRTSLEATLNEVPLVLNCAGPFQRTFQPIVDACLHISRHYLDITGEFQVFEALAARDAEAKEAGVMLLPGIGFDVVPSDCLAAHLKQRIPEASHLALAISGTGGGRSRGTTLTMFDGMLNQGRVRKDGKIVQVPLLWKTREVDFGRGPRSVVNIPWADVASAYYSTGIPNIETYMYMSASFLRMVRLVLPFIGLARQPLLQRMVKQLVKQLPPGPTIEARQKGRSRLWGEVTDEQGRRAVSRLETRDGYNLTAETSLAAVKRVLAGDKKPGYQTPSLAYGADFILEFEGVRREDVELD